MLPNKIPIISDINTATNPIKNEIRAPTSKRLNKSLPYLSVPNQKVFVVIKSFWLLLLNVSSEIDFIIQNITSDAYSVYTNWSSLIE